MAWRSGGRNLSELVLNLKRSSIIVSPGVEEVMLRIDRAEFCPTNPYEDRPQTIGYNATISAPHMHAYMLEYIASIVKVNSRILDIGSGTGYLTACLGALAPKGVTVGIEHIKQLVELSIRNIQKSHSHMLESGSVRIFEGDGRQGYASLGPYDIIHVGAAAPEVPKALLEQLANGGRLIIPVGTGEQKLMIYDKGADGRIKKESVMGVRFVPLISAHEQLNK